MSTPESGVPWTSGEVDDFTQEIIDDRTEAAQLVGGMTAEELAADPALTAAFGVLGEGAGLTVTEVGSVAAGNSTTFPLVVGDYLFVTVASDNKVKAFSLADPDNPVEVDEVVVSAGPSHLAARGKYLFCWCQNAGAMVSIDISDPTTMTVAQTLTTRTGQRFTLNGLYAVVGGPESGGSANTLSVIDTSNPAAMAEVGTLVLGSIHRNIASLDPRHVLVASRDDNTLYVVDISDPRRPVQVGSLASLTQTLTPLAVDPQFRRGRPYVYALGYGNGKVYVIDFSNPASPRLAGQTTGTINAEWIEVVGRYGFVALRGLGGIDVLDLANPATPILLDTIDGTAARFDRLAVSGGRIYACEVAASGKVWTFALSGGRPLPPPPLVDSADQLDRTGIIAMRTYNPSSDYATTSATMAEVDAANVYWTFTAPRSGKVRLGVEAIWLGSASAWHYVALASGGSEVSNTQRGVGVDSGRQRREVSWLVTGLTPGATYTYTLMHASGTGGTSVSIAGNPTNLRGEMLFKVEAVPA